MHIILAMALFAGCVRLGDQHTRMILLNQGTLENRLRVAKEYVTTERLLALRQRALGKFPALKDADVDAISLSWRQLNSASGTDVFIVLTFAPTEGGLEKRAIVDYCAAQVRADLQSQFGQPEAGHD